MSQPALDTQMGNTPSMNVPIMIVAYIGGLGAEIYARLPSLAAMLIIGLVGKAIDVFVRNWLARRRDRWRDRALKAEAELQELRGQGGQADASVPGQPDSV